MPASSVNLRKRLMMTALASLPKITPEDLLRLPDGEAYELIDGQLRKKDVSYLSSTLAMEIAISLGGFVRQHKLGRLSGSDSSFQCFPDDPDKVRRPDAAYISYARLTEEMYLAPGHTTVCPELIIEVISPNDLAAEVDLKIRDWFAAGAIVVWSVHPEIQRVHVHRANGAIEVFGIADTMTSEDVLPGFRMPLAELFRFR